MATNKLTNVMSLTGLGLRDWMVQRISSVVLALYILFLLGFIIFHPNMQFLDWYELFENPWFRIFSILALLSLVLHAWVGMWTITTDYLKVTWVRLVIETLIILSLIAYLAWGIEIIYSISVT